MAAPLTVTSDKHARAHTHTVSENPAGPQNWHNVHAKHTRTSPNAAAKVAVLNQTGGLVRTHRMTALIHAADTTST